MRFKNSEKRPLDLIEEAMQVIKEGGLGLVFPYLCGTVPFVFGVLYFIADMSTNPFADNHLITYSLILAWLFFGMKACHIWFSQSLLARLNGRPAPSFFSQIRYMPSQVLIHGLGLIILPIAAILLVPIGWVYAFYQSTLSINLDRHRGFTQLTAQAWKQAVLWPTQSLTIMMTLSLFSLAVWLNVCGMLFFIPYMLKILFGMDSQFILNPRASFLNTTFLTTTLGLTYLCVDPILKTCFVLRCFYGAALDSGDDLRARLRILFPAKAVIVLLATCAMWGGLPSTGLADETSVAEPTVISKPELDESIQEVMERPEFSWRMPRDIVVEEKEEQGFLGEALAWMVDQLEEFGETILGWIRDISRWLEDLFPKPEPMSKMDGDTGATDWGAITRILLWGLLAVGLIFLAVVMYKYWKARKDSQESDVVEAAPIEEVDLMDEMVTADRLTTNAWMELAKELMAKGALLKALRAFYLAALAHLAQEKMISIARYKSNWDYQNELSRKARDKAQLLELFNESVKAFEKHWYGMYPVDRDVLNDFANTQQRILAIVQQSL